MKLPIRPEARPSGTHGAMMSVISRNGRLRRNPNNATAASTPSSPPWNDMPPFQTAKISSGLAA
jgi:hypothetical protein